MAQGPLYELDGLRTAEMYGVEVILDGDSPVGTVQDGVLESLEPGYEEDLEDLDLEYNPE
ncbi:MAG: hypothetical protein ABEK01_05540 [Candidatus Nanohaloarchaea archaeon]